MPHDDGLDRTTSTPQAQRIVLESSLRYHLRCLREDATNPDLPALERLALVRDQARRIREIRQALEAAKVLNAARRAEGPC
jgi:hypothetical protein